MLIHWPTGFGLLPAQNKKNYQHNNHNNDDEICFPQRERESEGMAGCIFCPRRAVICAFVLGGRKAFCVCVLFFFRISFPPPFLSWKHAFCVTKRNMLYKSIKDTPILCCMKTYGWELNNGELLRYGPRAIYANGNILYTKWRTFFSFSRCCCCCCRPLSIWMISIKWRLLAKLIVARKYNGGESGEFPN